MANSQRVGLTDVAKSYVSFNFNRKTRADFAGQ